MPTLEHNGLVEMFRENPSLAPHFLATLFLLDIPPHASVAVVESSLDQLIPVEFRADLVLELKDAGGALVLAIVLEVQRNKDHEKKFSWPVYLAAVWAKKRCPAIVLIVAPDDEVAAWAAEAIDLSLGLSTVRALVLGPKIVPEVTDRARAQHEPELAIISAVAHGNGPNGIAVLDAAYSALRSLDREHAAAYFEIVYNVLREPLRKALETLIMERQKETNETIPALERILMGIGERAGKLEGKREVLVRLATRAGIELSEHDRARIQSCTDDAVLDQWVDNVSGAKTAADVLS
jgi:hypothetical protein